VPLFLEYEAKLLEQIDEFAIGNRDVWMLLNYLASVALHQEVFFLWRPVLRDPKDDMVLELAVAAEASSIVTHNWRDFEEASTFAPRVVSPGKYLIDRGLNQ
jgi:predicted nucleic acid-binding protein